MKKIFHGILIMSIVFTSCSKSDDVISPITEPYMTLTAGSVWNYDLINVKPGGATIPYTLTSTIRDSSILGVPYHVFINSNGNNTEYYNIDGTQYHVYQKLNDQLSLGNYIKLMIYLNSEFSTGTSWSQNFNIVYNGFAQILVRNNTILEKGVSRTVNGITYNNVICVQSIYSMPSLPNILKSNIKSYYAPKYGLIEDSSRVIITIPPNSDTTITNTILKTATIL